MKKYRLKSLIVVALVALSAVAAPHKSILSLKESITDDNIQFPYSFETNTQELMKNWYLQNYAVLDKDVENKDPGDVSDATYISRLKTIPSGIELPFNQVVKSYIERYTHRERTLVAEMLGMSPYYMPIFEQALEKRGMPLELKYIPVIESALDPNAVSPVGASGLWQFMLETARNQGLEVNSLVDERRDPYRSSDAAADYFKKLYDIYGDWSLAIAAYNCGPGNVNKALLRAGDGSAKPDFWEIYNYLPRETRGYVPAFIAATYVMHYYKEHNISPSLATKPLLIDTVKVSQRLNFAQISKVLNIPIDEIRILNPQYRHDVIPGDARPYTLALPSQQVYSFILVEDSINSYRPDLYAARDVREPGTPNDAPTANNYGYSAPTMQAPAPAATQAPAQPATQAAAAQPAATPVTAAAATKYYKVKRGEDIASVASSFGISVDQLMTLNSLTRRHVSRGQVLKVPDVAQKAAAAPSQPSQPAQPAQAAQSQPSPAPVAATPVASSSASGTYTPYAGSYSIDDEVTREISESYSHKSSRSSDDSEATGHKTTRKTEQESKASQDDGSKKKASRKQARDDEAESSKSSSGKKARARKAAHDDEQEQVGSKRSRSRKASRGDDGEETTSKKKSRRSRARQQDDEPKMDAHEVKRGESLERIARNNDMTVDELKKANPKIKGNHIEPGQTVNIPVKKKSKATKCRKSRENDDEASASSKKKRSKRSSSSDEEEKSSKKKSRRNR